MPHTQSAKKRLRQSNTRNQRSRTARHVIKTFVRKVLDAIKAHDLAAANTQYRVAAKKIDKAAARRIIHRNKAAGMKSSLATRIAKLAKAKAAPPAATG
jgi:small subunit ribosomal protein S20